MIDRYYLHSVIAKRDEDCRYLRRLDVSELELHELVDSEAADLLVFTAEEMVHDYNAMMKVIDIRVNSFVTMANSELSNRVIEGLRGRSPSGGYVTPEMVNALCELGIIEKGEKKLYLFDKVRGRRHCYNAMESIFNKHGVICSSTRARLEVSPTNAALLDTTFVYREVSRFLMQFSVIVSIECGSSSDAYIQANAIDRMLEIHKVIGRTLVVLSGVCPVISDKVTTNMIKTSNISPRVLNPRRKIKL